VKRANKILVDGFGAAQILDQRTIKLQIVGAYLSQLKQSRLPGSEIIKRQFDIKISKGFRELPETPGFGNGFFMNLQNQLPIAARFRRSFMD
jgi:hypothetical protein